MYLNGIRIKHNVVTKLNPLTLTVGSDRWTDGWTDGRTADNRPWHKLTWNKAPGELTTQSVQSYS